MYSPRGILLYVWPNKNPHRSYSSRSWKFICLYFIASRDLEHFITENAIYKSYFFLQLINSQRSRRSQKHSPLFLIFFSHYSFSDENYQANVAIFVAKVTLYRHDSLWLDPWSRFGNERARTKKNGNQSTRIINFFFAWSLAKKKHQSLFGVISQTLSISGGRPSFTINRFKLTGTSENEKLIKIYHVTLFKPKIHEENLFFITFHGRCWVIKIKICGARSMK